MAQGGRGKKRCHFPPEGDTIGNAITRKCKLGMLAYITMDISVFPPEWYQSARFRVLAHALLYLTTESAILTVPAIKKLNLAHLFWHIWHK